LLALIDALLAAAPLFVESLIIHSGGEIDGHTYINSLEALEQSYRAGYRVFEMDFILMSDGEILCAHDLSCLREITGIADSSTIWDRFLGTCIHGRYSLLSEGDAFAFFNNHP